MSRAATSPEAVVLEYLQRTRSAQLIRRFVHGAGGTALVSLNEEQVVLKAWPAQSPTAANLEQALALMAVMRARGVPIPEVIERGQLGGHRYLLYERLPGRWPARVTPSLLHDMIEVIELERGAAARDNNRWSKTLRAMLHNNGDPLFGLVPAMLQTHPAGSQLLAHARARLAECDPMHLTGGDIMHGDFAPENALAQNGRLSGLVDWEQCRPGDASLDLVGFLYDIELGARASEQVHAELRNELQRTIPQPLLALYVALYAARYASWAIGTDMEADVLKLGAGLTREFAP